MLSHRGQNRHVLAMRTKRFQTGLMAAAICGVNLLFVVKYAPRTGTPWLAAAMVYILLFGAVLWLGGVPAIVRVFRRPGFYAAALVGAAALLAIVMLQFDPATLRSGRAPAINDWLGRFLHGEYPYGSGTSPSGFPFLFILALPFYLLGEVGWWHIASFVLFGLLLFGRHRSTAPGAMAVLLCSPAFLYEVIVRSELFSNMVVVILYLWLFERFRQDRSPGRMIALGLLGGLVLSTRGVVLIVYAVYFAYAFRRDLAAGITFALGILISFAATALPFVIWDADRFIHSGPLAIQASYLPPVWTGAILLLGVACGFRARSSSNALIGVAALLLVCAAVAFARALATYGWAQAVWQDKFDISYFSFSLAFLLLANLSPALSQILRIIPIKQLTDRI